MKRPSKLQWIMYDERTDIIEPMEAPITDEDDITEIMSSVVSERQVIGWGEYTRLLAVTAPYGHVGYYLAD